MHKFRSVPEFKPHAIWLMNTKLSLDDHTAVGVAKGLS